MNYSKIFLWILIIAMVVTLLATTDSNAIPAFARRYKISCTTCHAPFPKLKPYGDEFAGNGFIMKENEQDKDYVTAGDDLLWLNKTFPVAVRFDAFAVLEKDNPVDKDLQTPYGLKLLSGGTLFKNIGYYFYFYFYERGEIAGVEDAYLHFDNLFDSNLDVLVGQFQTCDPLMKRELRLTFEDYMIYKQKIGLSRTNLAYDRGFTFAYSIEKTETDIIAMVVNGNGKEEAGDNKKFDDDPLKNFGLRINQGFGDVLSIGGFFYRGKEKILDANGLPGKIANEITYFGPDLNIGIGPLAGTFQYLLRKDTNPLFLASAKEFKTKGVVAEITYSPQLDKSRFFLTGLFNKIDSDEYDYETATLSGTYLLARNLRFIVEFTRDLENELNIVVLGLVSGF